MTWLLILVLYNGGIVQKPVRTSMECEIQAKLITQIWNEEKIQIVKHLCRPDKNAV